MIIPETPPRATNETSHALSCGEDSGSSARPKLTSKAVASNLSSTLLRFSDDASSDPLPSITTEESVLKRYCPKGLEDSFQQLYSILYPSLHSSCPQQEMDHPTENNSTGLQDGHFGSSTGAAILMGPRGSGKSLIVERCLAACLHQLPDAKFRIVSINGIVCRGGDVASVVYEMIKQLSDLAIEEGQFQEDVETCEIEEADSKKEDGSETRPSKRAKKNDRNKRLLRLRKSPFTSNLALLESIFKIAEVDKIPILLVLDEFDGLSEEGERQVLLYHLFDRVATTGSNLVLIGLTSNFNTMEMLEKRIQSRAEGTAKMIYVQPPASYDEVLGILNNKLAGCLVRNELLELLQPPSSTDSKGPENQEPTSITNVARTLERQFRCGKGPRWFCRVVSCVLSRHRFDCSMADPMSTAPSLTTDHFMEALAMMGASVSDEPQPSSTQQQAICMVNGQAVEPRLQALLDLPEPQLALLFAAVRVMRRDSHREAIASPMTIQRMLKEYDSFRQGTRRSSKREQLRTCFSLLERGLIVPAMDHSGGGPLQYDTSPTYKTLDEGTISRIPMHLPYDFEREIAHALSQNLLDCTTALKEWGRKTS